MSQPSKEILEKYAEFQLDSLKPELQDLIQSTFQSFSEDPSKSSFQESQNLHHDIEKLNRKLQEIQQALNCQTQTPDASNSHEKSSSSILYPTIKALRELQESTNMLIQKGKTCFPKEKIAEDAKVRINRFYPKTSEEDEEKRIWVLNVVNETKCYFRKVEFFILEDQLKIAEIRLFEPEIDLKKQIGAINVNEIYGKHLIAKVDDSPVSEIFPIMKIEFKGAEEVGEEENFGKNALRCTILNSSPEDIDGLYVFCNETSESFNIGQLNSGEAQDVLIPYGDLKVISLRVMREKEVMSIAFALNLGEEEEEESSGEEVVGNGQKPPVGDLGLFHSNPFPMLGHQVIDPAVAKVNEYLKQLSSDKIKLSEIIKRNYPGIESKMQLFKAVSRHDTYEECIEYLADAGIIEQ